MDPAAQELAAVLQYSCRFASLLAMFCRRLSSVLYDAVEWFLNVNLDITRDAPDFSPFPPF